MLWLTLILTWQINASDFIIRNDVGITMPSPPDISSTSLMWWNIGCSSTLNLDKLSNDMRSNFSPDSSWKNLETIIDTSYEPDILILGEYCPSAFSHPTYKKLEEHYPHIHRVVKTNPNFKKRNGLRVFSKHPLNVLEEFQLGHGNFVSDYLYSLCPIRNFKKNEDWTRNQSIIEVKIPKKNFTLFPVHLANPWKAISVCKNPLFALGEIYTSETNVNYVQTLEVIETVQNYSAALIIGDFNTPKRGGWFFDSNAFKNLQTVFGETLINSTAPTYLDKTKDFPAASIDHAFSKDIKIKYGEVLPLSGSDHLPIMVAF